MNGGLDHFIPDAVEPFSYGFLILSPSENGVVEITR